MKVAFVITKSELGGAQEYVRILLEACNDIDRILIVGSEGFLTEIARSLNVKVYVVKGLRNEIRPLADLNVIIQIYNILKEEKPTLVHLNSSKAGIVGRIAAFLTGIPNILTAHGWPFAEGVSLKRKFFARVIERILSPLVTKIICVSKYDYNLAMSKSIASAHKLSYIHNGIPNITIQNFVNSNVSIRDYTDALPLVGMIARFSNQKDHTTLFKAVASSKVKYNVICIGEGELLQEMQSFCKELKIECRVSFLGARKDIPKILEQLDILVLISNYEGLPISIIEGMRSGLPIIASRVGGVEEAVVDGYNGFLIERKNDKQLALKLDELVMNESFRKKCGENSRELYVSQFNSIMMVEKTRQIYEEVSRQ